MSPIGTYYDQLLAFARALDRSELDAIIEAAPPAADAFFEDFFGADFDIDDPFLDDPVPSDDVIPDDTLLDEPFPDDTIVDDTRSLTTRCDRGAAHTLLGARRRHRGERVLPGRRGCRRGPGLGGAARDAVPRVRCRRGVLEQLHDVRRGVLRAHRRGSSVLPRPRRIRRGARVRSADRVQEARVLRGPQLVPGVRRSGVRRARRRLHAT